MKPEAFRYCTRLERSRQAAAPNFLHAFRALAKSVFVSPRLHNPSELPSADLLFVVITENHLKHFKPIAQELDRVKAPFIVLFTHWELFEKYGGEWLGRSACITGFQGQKDYFYAAGCLLRLGARALFADRATLAVALKFSVPCCRLYHTALQLFAGRQGKLVVFKAEGYHANALLLAARKCRLTSFAIQHGLIAEAAPGAPLAVDHYFVWSDLFAQRLKHQQAGCAVSVTGNAAYDAVFQAVQQHSTPTRPGSPLQLLALPNSGVSHTPPEQVLQLLDFLLRYSRQNSAVGICIKPHPADRNGLVQSFLRAHAQETSDWQILDRNAPIPFEKADLAVVNNSGAGMEACIWSVPVLVVAPRWEAVQVKQYVEAGAAAWCSTFDDFNAVLKEIADRYADYQQGTVRLVEEQLAFRGCAAATIVGRLTGKLAPDRADIAIPK